MLLRYPGGSAMKIRILLLTLACSLLMTGCITAGYGYGDAGYYGGTTTIEYRSNRGYPYGYYDGYYGYPGYGYPYGYGSRYGYDARYRYSYPYGYGGYYGRPGPYYRSRPVYPRYDGRYDGHRGGGYPHRDRSPGHHSDGKPPWRDLQRIPQPGRGHSIAPPSGNPSVPAPSFRPSVGGGEDRPSQPRRERGRLQGEIKAAEDRE